MARRATPPDPSPAAASRAAARARLDQAIAHALELLEPLEAAVGPITHRKMFGGAGLYAQGRIFAVLVDGELMLKGDAALGAAFEAAGGARWVYDGKSAPTAMPYWRLPAEAADDPSAACDWARRAIDAAAAVQ